MCNMFSIVVVTMPGLNENQVRAISNKELDEKIRTIFKKTSKPVWRAAHNG
jgi:hypothetical protein